MAPFDCQDCPILERVMMEQGGCYPKFNRVSIENLRTQQIDSIPLTLIFAQADKVRDCLTCKRHFTEVFGIPKVWWSPWCRRSNGYFGCEVTGGGDGEQKRYNTWFRFLVKQTLHTSHKEMRVGNGKDYQWVKLNVFTRWNASTKGTFVIVFDASPTMKADLTTLFAGAVDSISLGDPYFSHALLAGEVLRLQNDAVWNIRNLVRSIEHERTLQSPDFPALHDLARHAIHVLETLDLAARTLDSMILHNDQFDSEITTTDATVKITQHHINDRLVFYREAIQGLRLRSISNKDRLQNEIQLSFNMAAQNIASASMSINRIMQSDSSVMRTLGLTAAVFIPFSYIATLFDLVVTRQNIDSGKWNLSNKFWVYWAISIPVACTAAVLSYLYHRKRTTWKTNDYMRTILGSLLGNNLCTGGGGAS